MADKPGLLRNLRFKRVSLVDSGANYDAKTGDGAHIMLYKAKDPIAKGPGLGSVHVDSPDWDHDDQDEYEKATLSGDSRRELPDSSFAAVWTDSQGKKHRKLPIHDAGHLAAARGRIDAADIPADVKAAARRKIEGHSATPTKKETPVKKSIVERLVGLFGETDVEKRNKEAAEILKAVSHDPDAEVCKCEDCMQKALDADKDKDKNPFGKQVVALEKQATELQKTNTELKKRNDELAAAIEVEKSNRLDNEMRTFLKSFKATPFVLEGADSDVPRFRKMKEADPVGFERQMTLLKSQDALIAKSVAFDNIGVNGGGAGASAWNMIVAEADKIMEKDTKGLTQEQAQDLVMKRRPDLFQKYREETNQSAS